MPKRNETDTADPRVRITARLPVDVHTKLVRRARRNHRSVNAEILHTLQRSVARGGKAA